jgi:hypothetical protein
LAKTSTPARDTRPSNNNNAALQPQPKDPRHELFYLLGVLRGGGVDNAVRIAELVNELLVPAAPGETGGE